MEISIILKILNLLCFRDIKDLRYENFIKNYIKKIYNFFTSSYTKKYCKIKKLYKFLDKEWKYLNKQGLT